MGVHVANGSIKTSNKGTIVNKFSFAVDASGDPVTVYQAGGNFVSSVTHSDTGEYLVQFNQNYPVRMIHVGVQLHSAAVTDDFRRANYRAGSYGSTDGQMYIDVSKPTADNDMSQVAADPLEDSEIHVEYTYVYFNNGIGD